MKNSIAIVGYEGRYEATQDGKIISLNYRCKKRRTALRQHFSYNGYLQVGLYDGEKQKTYRVNRLIAEAFHGKPPGDDYQVNHKDGNKLNNHYLNLEWCTYEENHSHAIKNGLRNNIGEKHGNSKLSDIQVKIIKTILNKKTMTQREVAKYFKVHYSCINHIAKGRQWNHIKA